MEKMISNLDETLIGVIQSVSITVVFGNTIYVK